MELVFEQVTQPFRPAHPRKSNSGVRDREKFPNLVAVYAGCGNFALVSQKSLMLFTRFSNALNSTGLQT